ncbi:unnamed protein product, partial [Scytosiphon promiscuus]
MKMKNYNLNSSLEFTWESKHKNKYDIMTDSEVWNQFLKGDGEAFNHIYYHYFPILFNYGHQFCQDKELIKDLIQDFFIYLKAKRQKLGKTDNIKFYLYRAIRRRIVRNLSKKQFINYVDNYPATTDFEISLSHEATLIQHQEQKELKRQLEEGLEKLSKRQKAAIIYYYYEGFNYDQIAEIMTFPKVEHARK